LQGLFFRLQESDRCNADHYLLPDSYGYSIAK